jgi:hypothetical protein
VAKYALETTSKLDDVLKVSKGLKVAKVAIEGALKAIKAYVLSPTRNLMKSSLQVLTELTKKGSVFLAETKTGKVLVFSGKAVSTGTKIILYPIDNPMTTWAFKAGERSFEKIFKLGAPKLTTTSAVVSAAIKSDSAVESTLVKIEKTQLASKPNPAKLLELEEELYKQMGPKRLKLLDDIIKTDNYSFNDVVKNLFPELQYGPLAEKLGSEKILLSEKELLDYISKLPEGAAKENLLKQFELHVSQNQARSKIVGKVRAGGKIYPEDSFAALKVVEVPEINPNILDQMNGNEHYSSLLKSVEPQHKKATAKSLKLLENAGIEPSEVAKIYKKHEKYFLHIQKTAPIDSDAPALLAEFIKRQKKLGLSDEMIEDKLGEAFKKCD